MKKCLCLFMVLMLLVFGGSLTGCAKKIKAGEPYYLMGYDVTSDRFVKLGSTLSFGKDFRTFERVYADGNYTIFGSVVQTSTPNSYIISCSPELADAFYGSSEVIATKEQFYVYGEYLFSGSAIELYHTPDDKSADLNGYYHMEDTEDLVYLSNGNMYVKGESGDYNDKVGYYTVNHDILTLTSVDANGKDAYRNGVPLRKKYLLAKITLSNSDNLVGTSDVDQLGGSSFMTGIYAEKSAYSGKTIIVLADRFFALNFD